MKPFFDELKKLTSALPNKITLWFTNDNFEENKDGPLNYLNFNETPNLVALYIINIKVDEVNERMNNYVNKLKTLEHPIENDNDDFVPVLIKVGNTIVKEYSNEQIKFVTGPKRVYAIYYDTTKVNDLKATLEDIAGKIESTIAKPLEKTFHLQEEDEKLLKT